LTQNYQECDDVFEFVVKSMNVSVSIDIAHVESKIENLMNLRHPCILGIIGVIFASPLHKQQIIRENSVGKSLSEVISRSPEWWTPTAKAKAIVGIVLGMRFAHNFGLLHGHLTGDNVVFDDDGLVQICDFCENSLSEVGGNSEAMAEDGSISGEGWKPSADVRAFAELVSRIVIGDSSEERECSRSVPGFILNIIERRQSLDSNAKLSFVDIFETLKDNDF
jgi:serine/threonine protein kinase